MKRFMSPGRPLAPSGIYPDDREWLQPAGLERVGVGTAICQGG